MEEMELTEPEKRVLYKIQKLIEDNCPPNAFASDCKYVDVAAGCFLCWEAFIKRALKLKE